MTGLRLLPTVKPEMRRSAVQNLLVCEHWESGSSEAAAFGSLFHRAAELYLKACREHRQETRLGDVDAIVRAAMFDAPGGVDPGRFDELRGLLEQFATTHVANLRELIDVEVTLRVETEVADLHGTLDRLDRLDDGERFEPPTAVRVVDYKTQYAVDDHVFQMRFYAALACLTWPTVEEVVTVADHVHRIARGQVTEVYDRDLLLQWWGDVVMYGLTQLLERRVRGELAPPVGGAACQYCVKRRTCGAALEGARAIPVTDEEAVARFRDVLRIKAAYDDEWAALKAFFDGRPSVIVDNLELGWLTPAKSWRCTDPMGAIQYLAGRGADPAPFVSVLGSKLTKKLKDALVRAGCATDEFPGDPVFKSRKATFGDDDR